MRLPSTLLLCVACTEAPGPVWERGPLPPPPALTLDVSGVVPKQAMSVEVGDAPPGARVTLLISNVGPGAGPCLAQLAGACVELLAPSLVGGTLAGSDGVAEMMIRVPPVSGSLWLQAALAAPDGPGLSAVLEVPIVVEADADNDRLPDTDEQLHGTDPGDPDTDGDQALDGVEVKRGLDPLRPDTDGDGLADGIDLEPLVAGPQDSWIPVQRAANRAGASVPDPEMHAATGRVTWQTSGGSSMWVADIDPSDGTFIPSDGRGVEVDRDLGGIGVGGNGPEWVESPTGPQIAYVRPSGSGYALWYAREIGGAWATREMPGRSLGKRPYGQHVEGASEARVIYRKLVGAAWANAWRVTDDPADDHLLPADVWSHNTRFALDDESLLIGSRPVGGQLQVFSHHLVTGETAVLTSDLGDKHDPYLVMVPEWGGESAIVALRGEAWDEMTEIVVYRQVAGAWTPVHIIPTPAAYPLAASPELFRWNDRTYVSFVATERQQAYRSGPAQVYIAAIDPAQPLQRQVSDIGRQWRSDPEPYVGGVRPWVYYSGPPSAGGGGVWICELGL
jgi:hypothetical protein